MASSSSCSQCGTRRDARALGGVCPVCSLQAALAAPGSRPQAAEAEQGAGPESKAAAPASGLCPSRPLGDYELLEEIARRGMGVVYKARQASLGRHVAVKMLPFGALARPEEVKRFRAEASVAASLQHPNIIAIHEVGVHQDQHYLVMDYVDGPTLADLIAGGPLPPMQAAGLMQTVAEAIQYAHERGILHRDFKSSNVLVDHLGQPRVADFGLAKRLSDSAVLPFDPQLTLTGQLIGSPNYMGPEQAAAKRGLVGPPLDVYGLGAILYHLITSRPPFTGPTPAEVLHQVLRTRSLSVAKPWFQGRFSAAMSPSGVLEPAPRFLPCFRTTKAGSMPLFSPPTAAR